MMNEEKLDKMFEALISLQEASKYVTLELVKLNENYNILDEKIDELEKLNAVIGNKFSNYKKEFEELKNDIKIKTKEDNLENKSNRISAGIWGSGAGGLIIGLIKIFEKLF